MAKQYYAATKIKFGKRTENDTAEGKYESKVFEPGDKVTGLDVEDMKGLWNAGALTDQAPAGEEEASDEEPAKETPSTPEATPVSAKSTPAKATAGNRGTSQS